MARSSVRWLVALSVGVSLAACNEEGGGQDGNMDGSTGTPEGTTGDMEGTGEETASTGAMPPEIMWEFEPVFGTPNLDDDDNNGALDWYQVIHDQDDDVSHFEVPAVATGSVMLRMNGDLDGVRVWHGNLPVLGSGDGENFDTYEFAATGEVETFDVEFGDDKVFAGITAYLLDDAGTELAATAFELRSSPLILNHHLQPTEHVWVVEVDFGGGDNFSMVADYEAVLGDQFTAVPGPSYDYDVWIQDEIQLATSTGPGGMRADTVIDSIRDRGLDPFAEDYLGDEPDFNIRTWGNPQQATTWDSFGNLENSPPVTVDGVEYPFGRIYYGKTDSLGIHDDMAAFLESQDIQAPVRLDTFWLCVGHVDEFTSFVPDPDSPKGFKFLITDVNAAIDLLEGLDPGMGLGYYGPDHGYATVGDILGDAALINLNLDLQADEIDPMRELMIAEFGLEESDIVYMPSLFETIGGCGGGTAALIPGMVNLIVANLDNGESHVFIPDPFFRPTPGDQSQDPVIDAFTANLPASLYPHYVDDWYVYHLGLGEVHCGTNMTRTPTDNWWEVALHLL